MLNDPSAVTVCVVIPLYNAAASIQRTLDSVCAQTRLPDKVIVVDDGSSDAGPEIVKHYAAPLPIVLLQQPNQGPASARNRGVFSAEETFIAFLDADDRWHPEKLQNNWRCTRS